jgi:hypothetical protein
MVSSSGVDAESKILSLLSRSYRSHWLAVPKGLGTVIEVNWQSEAESVLGSGWNHDSGMESDISVVGFLADSFVGNFTHVLHDSLTVSFGWFSVVKFRHKFVSILDSVSVE